MTKKEIKRLREEKEWLVLQLSDRWSKNFFPTVESRKEKVIEEMRQKLKGGNDGTKMD